MPPLAGALFNGSVTPMDIGACSSFVTSAWAAATTAEALSVAVGVTASFPASSELEHPAKARTKKVPTATAAAAGRRTPRRENGAGVDTWGIELLLPGPATPVVYSQRWAGRG